jgi:hypothetical protein
MDKTTFSTGATCNSCRYCDAKHISNGQSTPICRFELKVATGFMPGADGAPMSIQSTVWAHISPLIDWCGKYEPRPN